MHHLRAVAASLLIFASTSAYSACDLSVDVGDNLDFSVKELTADSTCEAINLTITHKGAMAKNVMGHNWVLSKTEDMQGIAADGLSAGLDNDHIKPDDARVLAHTKMVGGGESDSISFSPAGLTPGGDYTFFCSFPGHSAVMLGKFIVK